MKLQQLDLFDKFAKMPTVEKKERKPKKETVRQEPKEKDLKLVLYVLKFVLLGIGIGASIMSFRYSLVWISIGLAFPFNYIATTIFIAFMVIAFELVEVFWEYQYYFWAFVFLVIWLFMTGYSMYCTIGGQYNSLREQNVEYSEKRKTEAGIVWQYKNLKETFDSKESQYNLRMKQVEGFSDSLISLDRKKSSMTPEEYEDQRWAIGRDKRNAEEGLKAITDERNAAEKAMNDFIAENPDINFSEKENEDPPDFYLWISGVLKVEPEVIQFWGSVSPALFYDVISPLSLYVVFFISGPKKKKRNPNDVDLTAKEKESLKTIQSFSFKYLLPVISYQSVPVDRVKDGILEYHIKRVFGFAIKNWFEVNEKG